MVSRVAHNWEKLKKRKKTGTVNVFSENKLIKKDLALYRHSQKSYSHFIKILQTKGHFYYLNEGYPFRQIFLVQFSPSTITLKALKSKYYVSNFETNCLSTFKPLTSNKELFTISNTTFIKL